MNKLFKHKTYLDVIQSDLQENRETRGYQKSLAEAAGMHPSYLSRILNHSTHLTPDQAAGFTIFWGLNQDETAYFLNLVHLDRAGSPGLKKIIQRDLEMIKKRQENLGAKLPAEKIETDAQNIYYSAWYYGAIHLLLTIPEFQTLKKISDKLKLPESAVHGVLHALAGLKLAQRSGDRWLPTKSNIHLGNNSWMAGVHHANWRLKVAANMSLGKDDLHYTGVHTLSVNDFERIKDRIQDMLIECDKIIRPSKEEELACLSVDWIKI